MKRLINKQVYIPFKGGSVYGEGVIKEKAQDLVNQFRIVLMDEDTDCGCEILCTSIAIKNSLICVNEIIQSIVKIEGIEKLGVIELNTLEYWNNVKQELEKV